MKIINIFVAGSTALQEHREKLILWSNEQNFKYDRNGDNIRLSFYSSNEVGHNQDVYNKYISEKSDINIFIIDPDLKDITKQELKLAKQTKKTDELWVYTRNCTPEVTSFLEGLLGIHYAEKFIDIADLVQQIHNRIDIYINDLKDSWQQEELIEKKVIEPEPLAPTVVIKKNYNIKKLLGITVFVILFTLLLGLIVGNLVTSTNVKKEMRETPILLITGGGSAANFIERYCLHYPVKNYEDGYYVHMPSSNSWLMLEEEAITPQNKDGVRYYPICVSAEQATDSCFISRTSKERFLSVGSVISIQLGQDTLMACLKNTPELLGYVKSYNAGYIAVADLSDIIKNDIPYKVNIFTTSKGSGTRDAYARELDKYISFSGKETYYFADNSDLPTVNKDDEPYVLLESKCYTMQAMANEVKNGHAIELPVKREDGSFVTKPIFLYFMAYCTDNTNTLKVPTQTLEFLKALGIDYSKKIRDGYLKRYSDDKIILDFNNLPDF